MTNEEIKTFLKRYENCPVEIKRSICEAAFSGLGSNSLPHKGIYALAEAIGYNIPIKK